MATMMKRLSIAVVSRTVFLLASMSILLTPASGYADFAVLVDTGVLVETNPAAAAVDDQEEPATPPVIGGATNASYVSTGGWAVTSSDFIDAAVFVFDFGSTETVAQATLSLPIQVVFPQNGAAPVQIFFYADNGLIEFTDYSIGFLTPIAKLDAALLTQIDLDVTGPVNAALSSGRYVGFRVISALAPESVSTAAFPAFTGVQFLTNYTLEFTPGEPPAVANDAARFDGFTLEVPNIDVPGVGEVAAQLRLIDANNLLFELISAVITGTGVEAPPLSGIELFDCAAFSPPAISIGGVAAGASSYSVISGVLDIPSVNFNNEQIAIRLEYIEGSDPAIFETLSLGTVQSGPSEALVSALAGGLIVEPSQDFIPLCHGWILIGDSVRNRVVERNIITGETGATYSFGTSPDQFTLDAVNGFVYMTVHPETERLYRLDLHTGAITSNFITQTFTNGFGSVTYNFALRDLALGEDGNIFAIMFDNIRIDPENQLPFTNTGLWLGLMDGAGNFLNASLPLESPIRIEYDPVQNHVFLATESNLATFNFDSATNILTFISGTDVAVGSGCTDFSISPDGNRLAYSCPSGNRPEEDFSIVDMPPEAYFDTDGEWFLGSSPISATFDSTGTLLIATDNEKLYFFDVVTHLILEDFELGLLEGEVIRKIRVSLDGQFLIVFLRNEIHAPSSKFYWMPMPALSGTPLP